MQSSWVNTVELWTIVEFTDSSIEVCLSPISSNLGNNILLPLVSSTLSITLTFVIGLAFGTRYLASNSIKPLSCTADNALLVTLGSLTPGIARMLAFESQRCKETKFPMDASFPWLKDCEKAQNDKKEKKKVMFFIRLSLFQR
ncbi:MAG: hypothetical protein EBV19_02910 [Flavobacteriia bacterium]|nr:hypothetical protein [Flavobacteriia bacterium]